MKREVAALLGAAHRVGEPEVGVADHAEHVGDAPRDHRLDHHVGDRARVRCGDVGQRDVDAVGAHLDREARGRVGEARRRAAGERVVVVAVPRAAQQPVLDRALAERAALVRAVVVERAVRAPSQRVSARLRGPSTIAVATRPSSRDLVDRRCHVVARRVDRVIGATPRVGDAGEVGHVAVERGEVVGRELRQRVVPARAGEHLHQLDGRAQEAGRAARRPRRPAAGRAGAASGWRCRPGSCRCGRRACRGSRWPGSPSSRSRPRRRRARAPWRSRRASRSPPVATSVTSRRARAGRGGGGRGRARGSSAREMLSRKSSGAAPVPPPRPSRMT